MKELEMIPSTTIAGDECLQPLWIPIVVLIAAVILLVPFAATAAGEDGPAPPAEETAAAVPTDEATDALTNDDVVQLVSLGLGEELVIAKIEQAPAADLDLGTESLLALKEQGVSEAIIIKMLERDEADAMPETQQAQAVANTSGSRGAAPVAAVEHYGIVATPGAASAFSMLDDGQEIELTSLSGDPTSVWAGFVVLSYLEFPGTRAAVRTSNPRPTFLARIDDKPDRLQIYLVETDPDDDDDTRSVKIGKAKMFSATGTLRPDKDWTVPYDASEEEPGLWRISPKQNLKPGEYGVYVSGVLHDFAVDR